MLKLCKLGLIFLQFLAFEVTPYFSLPQDILSMTTSQWPEHLEEQEIGLSSKITCFFTIHMNCYFPLCSSGSVYEPNLQQVEGGILLCYVYQVIGNNVQNYCNDNNNNGQNLLIIGVINNCVPKYYCNSTTKFFFNNAHVYLYTVAFTNRPHLGIDL